MSYQLPLAAAVYLDHQYNEFHQPQDYAVLLNAQYANSIGLWF